MKKIFATLLCAVLLFGMLSIPAFAASDIEFSMEGAEGTPGDTVEVKVYVDKNPGFWAAKFHTNFNDRYFTLLSVENGDVFTDGEFSKGLLTNRGYYVYYAEGRDYDVNIEKTGLILTLTFEISKACPNGEHEISLSFPDDGEGWFIDATEFPDFETVFSIECTKTAKITVTGSDATVSDETTAAPEVSTDAEGRPVTPPAPGIPVTEAVTDSKGEDVKDEDGNVVTQEVVDEDGKVIYYETDDKGEVVTDDKGESVTFAETTAKAPDENADPDETTGEDGSGDDESSFPVKKVVLIAAIAAVVVGAVIVIIVVTKKEKEDK